MAWALQRNATIGLGSRRCRPRRRNPRMVHRRTHRLKKIKAAEVSRCWWMMPRQRLTPEELICYIGALSRPFTSCFCQDVTVEIWLRTNARAVLLGTILPLAAGLLGLLLLVGLPGHEPAVWMRAVGGVLLAAAAALVLALLWQLRQPRLAYAEGHLLVWLRAGAPIRVPVEVVECFWLGQAPSLLPGKRHERTETAAVVIRIAERATEWHQQEVKPQLGKWCEGYITIRGTWCEPLNVQRIDQLNRRLAEVSRAASPESSPR